MQDKTKFTLKISKQTIVFIIVLCILNAPSFIFEKLTFYRVNYASIYAPLVYGFDLLELIVCIWGVMCYRRKTGAINMYAIMFFVLLKDLMLFLLGKISPFSTNSWEMYLCVIIGISICAIVCFWSKNESDVLKFLDYFVIINFIYQILFVFTGRVGSSGRVAAMSISFGAIGYTCALHVLYTLLAREKNKKNILIIIICVISLILSGSRFNLVLLLLGIVVFSGVIFSTMNKKKRVVSMITLGTIMLFFISIMNIEQLQEKYEVINRIVMIFEGNILDNFNADASFQERIESIELGIEIIKDNPFGLSNSFADVHSHTVARFFYSFPHSNVICYYLLWGLPFLVSLVWLVLCTLKAKKVGENGVFCFLLYILITFFIYGGLETSTKYYVYIFGIISVINIRLKKYTK